MAFIVSVVLVFGTFGWAVWNMAASDAGLLGPGVSQMIHAPLPWLMIGALALGPLLGIVSVVRRPAWFKWPVLGLEIFVSAVAIWYLAAFSWLPERELLVSVGDAFPAYSLAAHDGSVREYTPGNAAEERSRLYIFYRGDW